MSIVSISHDSNIAYSAGKNYSPDRSYQEYPFKHLPLGTNQVYELVRQCFRDAGSDFEHYDMPAWHPLGQWVKKGDGVFILPNLVAHRRLGESTEDLLAKCTHASVVSALLDYIFIATSRI